MHASSLGHPRAVPPCSGCGHTRLADRPARVCRSPASAPSRDARGPSLASFWAGLKSAREISGLFKKRKKREKRKKRKEKKRETTHVAAHVQRLLVVIWSARTLRKPLLHEPRPGHRSRPWRPLAPADLVSPAPQTMHLPLPILGRRILGSGVVHQQLQHDVPAATIHTHRAVC